jgi:DNA invertase Pin-like site-specific DNA recombinase
MTHFIRVFEDLKTRNIKFQSLTENIETETPQGRMFLHLLAAFAELERELIRERCLSGQIAARARGQVWGRKPSFTPKEGAEIAKLWRSGWWEQQTMAHWLGVNISTLRDTIYRSENRGRYATNKLQK